MPKDHGACMDVTKEHSWIGFDEEHRAGEWIRWTGGKNWKNWKNMADCLGLTAYGNQVEMVLV